MTGTAPLPKDTLFGTVSRRRLWVRTVNSAGTVDNISRRSVLTAGLGAALVPALPQRGGRWRNNGNGSTADPMMAWNPQLKFYNDSRRYLNTRITKDAMTTYFLTLDYVTTPGAPVSTEASFDIRDGVPGLVPKG
ncbi:MAG: hypothetical protein PVSMB10_16970 [Pseudarthrobacter sp.]